MQNVITLRISSAGASVQSMQGDSSSPYLTVIFVDEFGAPYHLPSGSLQFYVGTAYAVGSILDAQSGTVSFAITPDMISSNGEYACSVNLGGTQMSVSLLACVVSDAAFGEFTFLNREAHPSTQNGADLNTITQSGVYELGTNNPNMPSACANGQLIVAHGDTSIALQIASGPLSSHIFWRTGNSIGSNSESWGTWKEFAMVSS